jgi:hypothetical protein
MWAVVTALIAGGVSILVSLLAHTQWRKQLRNEVTSELIGQRVKPYCEFMVRLEPMSSAHEDRIQANPKLGQDFAKTIQEGIYGSVGILSSHITREILVYARIGCDEFASRKIEYHEWRKRIWAIPWALRSDLGIEQPKWKNEVDKLQQRRNSKKTVEETTSGIAELVNRLDTWKESQKMRV